MAGGLSETYNPFYDGPTRPEPRIRFSGIELFHLGIAVVVLAVSFAFILQKRESVGETVLFPGPLMLLASFLAVGSGFILHELAHKVVAQKYGHWAEFRAQFMFLGITLLLAMFTPAIFAAPGAVLIYGSVTHRENGVISIVGPGINLVIAAVALPFIFVTDPDAPLPFIMGTVARINALLALFNLLPFGPLDGKKVWRWNRAAWTGAFLLGVGLLLAAFRAFGP